MKKLACLLIAALSLVNVMAQITTASLRGVVKNQSNEVLVGCSSQLSYTAKFERLVYYNEQVAVCQYQILFFFF